MEKFVTAIIIACLVCCERARVWLFKKEKKQGHLHFLPNRPSHCWIV